MPTFILAERVELLIRQTGARTTAARMKVLAFLLAQQAPVTHREIEIALDEHAEPMDRVTLYRTLDWLTDAGLAHKVLGTDRAWHFRANEVDAMHRQHAHFKCHRCQKLVCLDGMPKLARMPSLPAGYQGMEIELTIKGVCADCAAT